MQDEELLKRFTYHPPRPGQPEQYQQIREQALQFARLIIMLTPECPEQSLSIRDLEKCVFWANASIARNP